MTLWLELHSEAVRQYVEAGVHSYAEIGNLVNLEFGTDYSRNSIIGKAQRLGLMTKRPPRGKRVPRKVTHPEKPLKPTPAPECAQLICVDIEPRNLTLHDLTDETCRWPYGDNAPYFFCGRPVFCGSYCGHHFDLATRSGG